MGRGDAGGGRVSCAKGSSSRAMRDDCEDGWWCSESSFETARLTAADAETSGRELAFENVGGRVLPETIGIKKVTDCPVGKRALIKSLSN